ncbi:DUF3526 domain-containing protein [Candidatus Methylospira mobilis]|uniref:DUF3526 domain-containing protein n=1 Tax=Candidatus Methylospira mobilis TaxID=1808979 RepID=UPI0028E98DD3|nr:DUF3526 domain-containing protein [Candidatus Methylospira mobilis]WNV06601.1 DUF3526 domain-containing protein [Candidatus Methylospira mobilis]
MSLLFKAEFLRFSRNPLNLRVLAAFSVLFCAGAIWAGVSAGAFRDRLVQRQQSWLQAVEKLQNAADSGAVQAAPEPWADLPALGGLVLSVRQFDLLNPEIRILTRSRYTDGRNSDQVYNPLLLEWGVPDFATLLVLLLPLMVVGLCYGLVQEDREQGCWRLVCAQTARPWRLVFAALTVRFIAVLAVAALASLLAFALDSGIDIRTVLVWLCLIAAFLSCWIAVSALLLLLPVSAAAAALGMLGVWLITTFGVPAALSWAANSQQPMPSRLTAIVAIRAIDAEIAGQRDTLLAAWYQQHPGVNAPADPKALPRQLTSLPANLELDRRVRPLQRQFDAVRQAQFELMRRYAFLSPALAVLLNADQLAGIDATRYAAFVDAVNRFEDQWRDYFVPRLMGGGKLTADDYRAMPAFDPGALASGGENSLGIVIKLLTTAFAGLLLAAGLRKYLSRP